MTDCGFRHSHSEFYQTELAMKYRLYSPLILLMSICLYSAAAMTAPKASESYGGSVNSFRWLGSPIRVSEVLIRKEQGTEIALSQFKGKIILLNLWASWCPPCVKELPGLDRLQQRLGGNEFVVVTVSLDEDLELARRMFVDLSIESLKLFSQSSANLAKTFPVDLLPVTIIIDRDGQAMGLLRGALDWDNSEAEDLINRVIKGVSAVTLRTENSQQ